jgi:hypothetical protein
MKDSIKPDIWKGGREAKEKNAGARILTSDEQTGNRCIEELAETISARLL